MKACNSDSDEDPYKDKKGIWTTWVNDFRVEHTIIRRFFVCCAYSLKGTQLFLESRDILF